ncbi:uncharacterized protein [Molothrus aeneus]|uniref:uncharacterized protein n=1 Tax=Molothrus aeneus TaxID=84833 RepID=UPI0034581BFE
MAGKVALLLWAQTLGLAGAQTTQLLVEPPWRPAVLWDRVTLTCQGSGTAGATTWPAGAAGAGTGAAGGDTVTLRCQGWWNCTVTSVSFYREEKGPGGLHDGTELSLSHGDSVAKSDPMNVTVLGVIVTWRRWHHDPPGFPGPPEEGEVLYTHVVVTKRAGASPRATTLQDPQVTYAELRGPQGQPREPGDIDGNSHHPGDSHPWQRVTASAHGWGHRDGREAQTLGLAGAQTTQLLVVLPCRPAVLWDRVTLTCQGSGTTGATTWYKDGQRWGQQGRDRLIVTEGGTYRCDRPGTGHSPTVTVLHDWLVLQVPARALLEGDTVTLHCRSWQNKPLTDVYFYHDGKKLEGLHDGTELSLSPLWLHHSGRYHCTGRVVSQWRESEQVRVTVHMPVANATITPGPLSHQVHAGDPVTLCCSVQVGSAPVTFTWLHNRQEVAQGPLLELRDFDVGHSGTYQCVATNQLGQDGHRMFWALSPELALEDPPLEERAVLNTHIMGTNPASPRDPQVTNTELSGPHKGQWDPCDYESVL